MLCRWMLSFLEINMIIIVIKSTFSFVVLDPPSNAIESDMNTVVEGSKLELRCPFSANPYDTAVVTWLVGIIFKY